MACQLEVWAEIPPSRRREKIASLARALRGLVDVIDVPEAPLGRPSAHAIAVAHVASVEAGAPAVANVRLLDVNANGLLSLLGAAELLGLAGVVLLQGDPPAYGEPVAQLSTEEAVLLARKTARRLQLGAILSLAKPQPLLAERLSLPLDFLLATRLAKPSQLGGVVQEARRSGKKIIPYIVVAEADEKSEVYKMLEGHQPVYEPSEIPGVMREIACLADGILVSAPTSHKALVEALKAARETRQELLIGKKPITD